MSSLISPQNTLIEKIDSGVNLYKEYFNQLSKDFTNKLDIIISPNFMNLEHLTKDIKFNHKKFEGEADSIFEKKMKYLKQTFDLSRDQLIICSNDQSIRKIKDNFTKKSKLEFSSVCEEDRVGQRLFSMMYYNKYDSNILLITPLFLKSVNLVKVKQIVLFDMVKNQSDFIRILSKFTEKENGLRVMHILWEGSDLDENGEIIEYFSNLK